MRTFSGLSAALFAAAASNTFSTACFLVPSLAGLFIFGNNGPTLALGLQASSIFDRPLDLNICTSSSSELSNDG